MARAYAKFWKDLDASGLTRDHKACALYCHFLCAASVTARSVVYNACTVNLQPGQLVTSRSELTAVLGLSDKEVRRAIKTLETLQLVGQQGASKYTLITLLDSVACEDEGPAKGQQEGQERASKGPAGGPTKGQLLYKEEERENKERENGSLKSCASGDAPEAQAKPRRTSVLSGWKLEAFNVFWKAYGWMKGRGGAEKAWAAIPNLDKALVARICEAARKEAAQRQSILAAGRTPKWAQGWLNERRWEDDYSQQEQTHRPYVPQGRQGQFAGMTWAEIRDEKNKQACRDAVREYLADKGIAMEEEDAEQASDEPWTVTVNE